MRIRVLGPVGVRVDGDSQWTRPPPQQRRVLASLLAPVGRTRGADHIAEVVWPRSVPDNADRLLQALVSRLRAAIGQQDAATGLITSVDGGWRIEPDVDVDSHQFDAWLDRARELARGGHHRDALEVVQRALDLWRGPVFGEASEHTAFMAEVTRLEEHRLEAHQLHLRLRIADGAHAEVIGELKELLSEHPLREQLWGLLMVALYRSGRQADALTTYQRLRRRLVEELGIEPSPQLQALHRRILHQDLDDQSNEVVEGALPDISTPGVRRVLPNTTTSFVGRRDETERVEAMLGSHALVSLVGPGGVGKTRLAVAAARAAEDAFAHGAALVDLSSTRDSVPRAVATTLGLGETAHESILETVREALGRRKLLLVLDNCEHRLDEVASLVEHLMATCPGVSILCTTRQRVGLATEQVVPVRPLTVEPAEGNAWSEAAQLFLDRVDGLGTTASATLVNEICRRLDGLPLAIELAAARTASLGLDGLLAGLEDRLQLLQASGRPDARHHSLRTVLDYSHELLSEREQTTFRRLAVFAASFDLDAATAVVAREATADVANDVGRLVDKSLLVHRPEDDHSRWSMLDTVREYARDRLSASGDLPDARARHLRWAAAVASDLVDTMQHGGRWRSRHRLVESDLATALATARTTDSREAATTALDLAFSQTTLATRRGSYSSAQATYELAVDLARRTDQPDRLARAVLGASVTGMTFGVSNPERVVWLREALEAIGDEPSPARVRLLARLGMELYWSVDRAEALAIVDRARSEARELDDESRAHALYAAHYVTRGPGNKPTQLDLSRRVVEHASRGDATGILLAGLAAHMVDQLAAGDMTGADAALAALWEAADRLQRPAFQWYTGVYRIVRALLEGRFDDADALTATVLAATNVAEFTVGLHFAQSITDLRDATTSRRRQRILRLDDLARRFPGVLVWRCLRLLHHLALLQPGPRSPSDPPPPPARPEGSDQLRTQAHQLADEVLAGQHRDAHWLVEASLLAEVAVELGDKDLAARLERELRPHAGSMAVAGRVGAFRGSVSHALGLCRMVVGDLDGAVEDLQQAVTDHRRVEARAFEVRTATVLTHVLERRDQQGDAARAARMRTETGSLST